MRVLIDRCVGCGHCPPFRPQEAISVYGSTEIDTQECRKCGLCLAYVSSGTLEASEDFGLGGV